MAEHGGYLVDHEGYLVDRGSYLYWVGSRDAIASKNGENKDFFPLVPSALYDVLIVFSFHIFGSLKLN